MSHDHATVAEEEYLQTIFWLQEVELPITGANIARAMQLSAPTVHEMVARLEADGYVQPPSRQVLGVHRSTAPTQAEQIVRRHRLIERFLTDVLDIPWDDVHEQAELMEHAMSPLMEEKMLAAIGDAKTCPHGHPIDPADRIVGVPLADCEVGAKISILRFENEAEDLSALLEGRRRRARPEGRDRLRRRRGGHLPVGRRRAHAFALVRRDGLRRSPTRRRRRAPRFPSSSCSPKNATAVSRP